jgi:hypothetical protein
MEVAWDEDQRLWRGTVTLGPDAEIGVVIVPGRGDRDTAFTYAKFALSRLGPGVHQAKEHQAKEYAATKLLEYYNYYQAHLSAGEQLKPGEFADRLRLEGIRFDGEGGARLYFGHRLYRGDYQYEGGLVVVEMTADGEFRRAYWVTEPDAREPRRIMRN